MNTSQDPKKEFQRIFEFCVKNRENSLGWVNSDIKNFLRWALYYRKLFTVMAPANSGKSERIAAVGVAWRTERIEPQEHELTFENTEFGENLFIFQVIVHPDFRHTGTLFQLLSLALLRYPGVDQVFWNSEHHLTHKLISTSLPRLLRRLASQATSKRLRKFIRRKVWEAVETKAPQFPTLEYLR